ncbi:MAG: hypothetical protein KatS3mg023_3485 [Armatimonadota bacterium]|nr:MAG: hypothetical protein KatS3mg023_3485 [Armatimonadota bacterium]
MKRLFGFPVMGVAVLLSVVLVAMQGSCWAQVAPPLQKPPSPAGQTTKKEGLAPAKRLEMALQKSQEPDTLLPVLMHTIERGLQGSQRSGSSELDRIFDRVIQRHPEVDRRLLQNLATDYRALPASVRTRGLPPALANLDPARPIDPAAFQAIGRMVLETRRTVPFRLQMPASKQVSTSEYVTANIGMANLPGIDMTKPHIVRISPATATGYEAGQKLTLFGWGFSANKADNTIRLFKTLAGGSQGEWTTLSPSVCSTSAIEFNLPSPMEPGQYAVQVSVKTARGVQDTNKVSFAIKTPPPPAPVLDSIAPSQYPGRKAILTGRNFLKTPNPIPGVYFLPLDEQPLASYVTFEGEKAGFTLGKVLSDTQVEITIPHTLLPGNYQVVMAIGDGISNRLVYPVRAFRYQVNFVKIHCTDESNPEWAGSDEIVTTWVVARDTEAWTKNTGEYTGFDDGDEQSYKPGDRTIFLPSGGPGEVKSLLAISTSLYEWDAGDAKAASTVIGFVGDLAKEILNAMGKVELAKIVAALIPLVQKVIAWLGGDPDFLGTRGIGWSALELLQATDNAQKRFTGTLEFRNSGDTGSYTVTYEVLRVE